jgi:hypothetical protein
LPRYFYIYNISSGDSATMQTTRAEIYLFTTGTPYKINSRTLVFASTGQWFFPSNLTAPSHSDQLSWSHLSPTREILHRRVISSLSPSVNSSHPPVRQPIIVMDTRECDGSCESYSVLISLTLRVLRPVFRETRNYVYSFSCGQVAMARARLANKSRG